MLFVMHALQLPINTPPFKKNKYVWRNKRSYKKSYKKAKNNLKNKQKGKPLRRKIFKSIFACVSTR